jgi:hypothetical protein
MIKNIINWFFPTKEKEINQRECENYSSITFEVKDNKKTDELRIGIVCRFNDMRCSICHHEFENNENIKVINGHKIHEKCFKHFDKICCCKDCSNAIYI